MLLTTNVDVLVTARTVNHYKSKGYIIPTCYSEKSNKDVLDAFTPILVNIEDLPKTSRVEIQYKCDCCGKIKTTLYKDWNKRKYRELGDLCKDCAIKIKLPQAMLDKYGCSNCANVPSIVEKKKSTNLAKYGNEWAIASEEVRNNISSVILNKYGYNNPMQNEDIKQKTMATNREKYGGNSAMCSPKIKEKSIKTCLDKYGVANPYQCKEVQERARLSRCANGNVPSSKAEEAVCNLLQDMYGEANCYHNYPVGNLSLDCLVIIDNQKIDVEYDGCYWHKNRQKQDRARNAVLMNEGYKIIRIKGNNQDSLPTKEQIQKAVDYLVKDNHHLTFIDMNN